MARIGDFWTRVRSACTLVEEFPPTESVPFLGMCGYAGAESWPQSYCSTEGESQRCLFGDDRALAFGSDPCDKDLLFETLEGPVPPDFAPHLQCGGTGSADGWDDVQCGGDEDGINLCVGLLNGAWLGVELECSVQEIMQTGTEVDPFPDGCTQSLSDLVPEP